MEIVCGVDRCKQNKLFIGDHEFISYSYKIIFVGDEKIDVVNDLESCSSSGSLKEFGDLPSQALSYIQQLESELTSVMEVTLLFLSV